jgi:hypothetical protein
MSIIDDYDWVLNPEEIKKIDFVPGRKYAIKSGNNWDILIFQKFDPEHRLDFYQNNNNETYEAYVFKDEDGYSTSTFGKSHLEDLASKGLVKVFKEGFSWKNELHIQKSSLDSKGLPVLKGNFIILFYNGIDIKETYKLQKKLFKLGFSWYELGQNLLTNKEVDSKIFTIESLNWDTTKYTYEKMDANQRNKKLLLISTFKNLDDDRDKERRLSFVHDHDIEVIDGYDLLSKI